MQKIHDCIEYTTEKFFWVNSGSVPSQISLALLRPDNVVVSSKAATSSGNGLYYGLLYMNPNSLGGSRWAIQEWTAVINANTYIDRQFLKIIPMNVGSP
jgi:hypothetical protein